MMQAATSVVILASAVERSVARNLLIAMTTSWSSHTFDQTRVLERAYRSDGTPGLPNSAGGQLIIRILRRCSRLLQNLKQGDLESNAELEVVLSLLSRIKVYPTRKRHILEALLRHRLLLSQFMAILKSCEASLDPTRPFLTRFLQRFISVRMPRSTERSILLPQLVIAGFPDLMRPFFERELRAIMPDS